MISMKRALTGLFVALGTVAHVHADVGDPQIRTDHPWYPGELAISTFDRLFATQAEAYQRVTGKRVDSDQQKALASWFWRNTHYWHGEAGRRDLWGTGFKSGGDTRLREYWNGLFGYGFGLCGATHSQWTAEFEHLLGHGRGRGVGAAGHNALEVFLQDDAYGEGRWALLDHDLSTVIFDPSGRRLMGLGEMQGNVDRWIVRYQIEYSSDGGRWQPIVADWTVPRRGDEPGDFWSQSFCYGSSVVESSAGKPIRIRFRNDGGKRYLRAEAHLVQKAGTDPLKVTYHWNDDGGRHEQSHVFHENSDWNLSTVRNVRTRWVEFEPAPAGSR